MLEVKNHTYDLVFYKCQVYSFLPFDILAYSILIRYESKIVYDENQLFELRFIRQDICYNLSNQPFDLALCATELDFNGYAGAARREIRPKGPPGEVYMWVFFKEI